MCDAINVPMPRVDVGHRDGVQKTLTEWSVIDAPSRITTARDAVWRDS